MWPIQQTIIFKNYFESELPIFHSHQKTMESLSKTQNAYNDCKILNYSADYSKTDFITNNTFGKKNRTSIYIYFCISLWVSRKKKKRKVQPLFLSF